MNKIAGKRIVITRPKIQSNFFVNQLEKAGAVPISFPTIEIAPIEDTSNLDHALKNLGTYDWFVITSVNGVNAVWERLVSLELTNIPQTVKFACIGPKTAAALKIRGVQPDFVPQKYIAEAILPGLGKLNGKKVLLTRADIARTALPEAIQSHGGIADDITSYCTIPCSPDPIGLREIKQGVDAITFTSPSTVRNFDQIMKSEGMDCKKLPGDPIIACIGPITSEEVQELGLKVTLQPKNYTVNRLVENLIDYYDSVE